MTKTKVKTSTRGSRFGKRGTLRGIVPAMLAFACAVSHITYASTVRVGIYTAHPPQRITITASAPLRLATCTNCRATAVAGSITLQASGNGVSYSFSGAGNAAPSPAVTHVPELRIWGTYRLTADELPPVEIPFPLRVRAVRRRLQLVVSMTREDYVTAVLAGEASSFESDEGLRAMSVAVRTYAAAFPGRHRAEGFDFCDTTHCQDFRWSAVTPRLRAAAESTQGELLWYQGSPARTYFHRHCGGQLAAAQELWKDPGMPAPYLQAKTDEYCLRRDSAVWDAKLTREDITRALVSEGFRLSANWRRVSIALRTPSGRAATLVFDGGGASVKVPAPALRLAVGRRLGWNLIRSDLYTVNAEGSRIVFSGRGYGHGVGFCQTGADEMGREGKSYREILAYYYPGTRVGLNAQGITWASYHTERAELLATAEPPTGFDDAVRSASAQAEAATGWRLSDDATHRPKLWLYSSLDMFRDATGEPGWVMASTRGRDTRLQPWPRLQFRNGAQAILRHELLHQLVEAHAAKGTPLWFREGLVLWLDSSLAHSEESSQRNTARSNAVSESALDETIAAPASETAMRAAYAEVRARVASMVQSSGKAAVLQWLEHGLPTNVR